DGLNAKATLDLQIAPLNPAKLRQGVLKSSIANPPFRIGLGPRLQQADAPDAPILLRVHCTRPCHRCSAEQGDEIAPPHDSPPLEGQYLRCKPRGASCSHRID